MSETETEIGVDSAPAASFGLAIDLEPFTGDWHAHNRHQLLYAAQGAMRVEAEHGQWLLPSNRAAWIPAGANHRASAAGRLRLRTLYLSPQHALDAPQTVGVFSAPPLLREMALHGVSYGPDATDAAAEPFFRAVGALVGHWAQEVPWLRLPRAQSTELQSALQWVMMHYGTPLRVSDVAHSVGMSERTFARRMQSECGCSFSAYLRAVRISAAIEALGAPGAQVTEVAFSVGFESVGAFSRAFRETTGRRPSEFRIVAD